MSDQTVILASGSASRRAVLAAAGIEAEAIKPNVDEDSIKAALRADGASVRDQAMALAELKAVKISRTRPGLVIGGDQMLNLSEVAFDKPKDLAEAKSHLQRLSGQPHHLETALVICQNGEPIWRHLARPKLKVRILSDAFIDDYIEACGKALLSTVGAYQLEGRGAQLFETIEGDFFSILGLPLLPLLEYFRTRGILTS